MTAPTLLSVYNPATGQLIAELPQDNTASVAAKAGRARTAQAAWAKVPLAERKVHQPFSFRHLG